jgi:hypothetical protein
MKYRQFAIGAGYDEMVKQQFNQVSASLKRWNVCETAHRRNLTDCLLNFSCAFSLSHHPLLPFRRRRSLSALSTYLYSL